MIRTCGSGLKLCMTPLGLDLLSEYNLRLFEYTTNDYRDKKPLLINNDDNDNSQAFEQFMND